METVALPAPTRGMRVTDAFMSMDASECVYAYNIGVTEYGFRVRPGYREQSNTTLGDEVWTLIPYIDSSDAVGGGKLFAATSDGIYDVTTRSATSTKKFDFTTKSGSAGYGVSAHFVNVNGDSFLYYADEENGLLGYTAGTDTWAAPSGFTFPVGDTRTVADLIYVKQHKLRLWFIPKGGQHAYYLPIGAVSGQLTRFDFGNKFSSGGALAAIYTWSVDGGSGIDDIFIAISSQGEVAFYKGADPSTIDTWDTVGTWIIGAPPAGRRIGVEASGDFLFLTAYGIISATALLRGTSAGEQSRNLSNTGLLRMIRARLTETGEFIELGWEIFYNPLEGSVFVLSPTNVQYVKNVASEGWYIWRDVDMRSVALWNNEAYFGDSTKGVWFIREGHDSIRIDNTGAEDIDFSFMTSYSDLGVPTAMKRVGFLNPHFRTKNYVAYETRVLYDFEVEEALVPVCTPPPSLVDGSLWDSAVWDSSVWGAGLAGSGAKVVEGVLGGAGVGRRVAIAVRGCAYDRAALIVMDAGFTVGGVL